MIKLGLPQRFGEMPREAGFFEACRLPPFAERGEHHQRQAGQRGIAFDAAAQFFPIHARHVHIEKGEVKRTLSRHGRAEPIQRRPPFGRFLEFAAPGLEQEGD